MPAHDRPLDPAQRLRIGIVGAGPGGLGAAIFLSRLENVEVKVFEQAKELREIGAGIHLQRSLFSMLELIGAREDITTSSATTDQAPIMQHRNGRTNAVLTEKNNAGAPRNERPVRTERTVLQGVLVAKVPKGVIQLGKRLVGFEERDTGIVLMFEPRGEGEEVTTVTDEVDLLIGADGIRSATRHFLFPESKLTFTGTTGFRILFPVERLEGIEVPDATVFFHGPNSSIFTTQVGRGLFEISTRAATPASDQVPWGRDVKKADVAKYYTDYHPKIQALIEASPEEGWKEFAYFGAPRLESVVSKSGRIALLGDASHPLSGAFGAGAGFALEDAFVVAESVQHARDVGKPLSYALRLYDETRSPHYLGLYREIERAGKQVKAANAERVLGFDDAVDAKVSAFVGDTAWIYAYDVKKAWAQTLERERLSEVATSGDIDAGLSSVHL